MNQDVIAGCRWKLREVGRVVEECRVILQEGEGMHDIPNAPLVRFTAGQLSAGPKNATVCLIPASSSSTKLNGFMLYSFEPVLVAVMFMVT
jgi:hypothetical protein